MIKKILAIILFISLIGGFWFYKNKDSQNTFSNDSESEWGNPEVSLKEAEKSAMSIPKTGKSYQDQFLNISFKYPENLNVSNLNQEAEEYALLVQDPQKNIGVQISAIQFIDPFNTLTEERIEGDLEIQLEKYSIIKIGKNQNIEAITFLTGESVKYREVWFVKGERLIQVKSYQSSEPLIIAILKTLEI